MTNHDRVRMEAATSAKYGHQQTDEERLEQIDDAIRGLQSTDDPDLVPLYEQLCRESAALEKKIAQNKLTPEKP